MVGIHINIEKEEGDIIFGADLQRRGRFQSCPFVVSAQSQRSLLCFFCFLLLFLFFFNLHFVKSSWVH